MRRREFIAGFAGSAAAWPLAARAQQPKPVIGLLFGATASSWARYVATFHDGLREAGYVEGRNVAIETRWAHKPYDRLLALAAELIQRRVGVLVAASTPAVHAAKAVTSTTPVVFTTISDPVQLGFVTSLGRPGGNMTGVTNLSVEVQPKLLELLHEMVPSAS